MYRFPRWVILSCLKKTGPAEVNRIAKAVMVITGESVIKRNAEPKKSSPTVANSDNTEFDVNIYSDGASDPNPGEAGSGVAVYRDNQLSELWYGLYNPNGTNKSAELNALHQALLLARSYLAKGNTVRVLSDSQYSINCISVWAFSWKQKGWKRKEEGDIKNLELIRACHELYQLC